MKNTHKKQSNSAIQFNGLYYTDFNDHIQHSSPISISNKHWAGGRRLLINMKTNVQNVHLCTHSNAHPNIHIRNHSNVHLQ